MRNEIDRPVPCDVTEVYGSDAIALMMRRLGAPYVALNPGSSFRGLHDSLVNHLGNRDPQMLLCLHEEHAVAIAHGWAKVTETPLAVILHANVGLMHAAMAVYNAWCDRVPMMIYGATGPVDAARRRPWIDWLHTSRDQAAVVRPYVKWDDQPASLQASLASMMRAATITATPPMAPTYVCFDVSVQEERLEDLPALPAPDRYTVPQLPQIAEADATRLLEMLEAAAAPVFLMGRVSRDLTAWDRRIALAERFGARVVTDIKTAAAFPTRHPLHVGAPGYFLSGDSGSAIADADLVVAFDWVDPAGTLSQAGHEPGEAKVVNITLEPFLQNGWSLDHQAMPPSDLTLLAEPDAVVAALCSTAGIDAQRYSPPSSHPKRPDGVEEISVDDLADALAFAVRDTAPSYLRVTLSWNGEKCDFSDPLSYLGYDGGAGIGSGPGMAVGAALALRDSGRLPVAVLGDGDFLMGATALWTATHHKVPLLIVVANNRSYFNDEVHQERIARERARPVENKHVGQAIDEPDVDIAAMARAQGAQAYGPVSLMEELEEVLAAAVSAVEAGQTVVVDVRVRRGYSDAMAKGMTEE
ncbi:thiamine pyrophosphate-binding protein [Tranquillimonas alkanivorans]|uniref:Acetolactate synthase large subunit n=1 Tax=Tranquillimonas alkanivorans TaxID=441119 RepID=A0A1I5UZ39_9RHOB|nr:thiamine pyrophosphate-binding protein [Tranquillimonas alkanivorans]SFQ00478.1 Acetolactate synthase large subunit [Tranquillimonas alkanivorans]